MGVLQYNVDEARSFTIPMFKMAYDGYLLSQGIKPPEERFVSRNELLDLIGKSNGS